MAYRMFKNGFLPGDDGWLKQTNKYIQIMGFIDHEMNLHEAQKNGRK